MPTKGHYLLFGGFVMFFGGSVAVPENIATSSIFLNPVVWGIALMLLGAWVRMSEDGRVVFQ